MTRGAPAIATIYQELLLFPDLTVAENIFMGHAPRGRFGRLDWRAMREQAREALLASLEIHDLTPTGSSARSPSAIASASRSARAVAGRAPPDHGRADRRADRAGRERLFDIVRLLKRARRRHHLYQPPHGRDLSRSPIASPCCATAPTSAHARSRETIADELVQMMVGRTIEALFPKVAAPIGAPVLEVRNLVRRPMTRGVSLTVRAGEIVGPRRPGRLRPQRTGADHLRRDAGRSRRDPARRPAGADPLARPGAGVSASPMSRRIAAPRAWSGR